MLTLHSKEILSNFVWRGFTLCLPYLLFWSRLLGYVVCCLGRHGIFKCRVDAQCVHDVHVVL